MGGRYQVSLRTILVFAVGVGGTLVVTKLINRPASFDECMVDALKGNRTNEAATAFMARACRAKFPWQAQPGRNVRILDMFELSALTGRAGLAYANTYSGDIYNGNTDLTVTEVEIEVRAITRRDTTARKYRTTVTIAPRATGHFTFNIIAGDPGSTYGWDISNAWGYAKDR